jgi:hypothetical protein
LGDRGRGAKHAKVAFFGEPFHQDPDFIGKSRMVNSNTVFATGVKSPCRYGLSMPSTQAGRSEGSAIAGSAICGSA